MGFGPGAPPPVVMSKQVILSPADIFSAGVTPISVIPGVAGKTVYLVSAYAELDFATTAYVGDAFLSLTPSDVNSNFAAVQTIFITSSNDVIAAFAFPGNVINGPAVGDSLFFTTGGDTPTLGDSPVTLTLFYALL